MLAIAVCCHFNEARLKYLDQISNHFASLGTEVLVVIVTNTFHESELKNLSLLLRVKVLITDSLRQTHWVIPYC